MPDDEFFDDDGIDCEDSGFDCPAFDDGDGLYCPLAGTEECDWECGLS